LHKLRRAMVRPGRDRLSGRIEVDEALIGGEEEGVHRRQTETKAMFAVAAEEDGAGIEGIQNRCIPDASADSLMPFLEDSVEQGSMVHTDGWLGYLPRKDKGYRHEVTFLKGNSKSASELMPRLHLAVALLKRWLLSTHQGGVWSIWSLPRRFHVPLQPAQIAQSGQAILLASRTSCCRRAGSLQILGQVFRRPGFLKPQDVGVAGGLANLAFREQIATLRDCTAHTYSPQNSAHCPCATTFLVLLSTILIDKVIYQEVLSVGTLIA